MSQVQEFTSVESGRFEIESTIKFGRASSWNVAARTVNYLALLLLSVLIVRVLGLEQYGVYSILRFVILVTVVLGGMGLGGSVLRYLPELALGKNRRAPLRFLQQVMTAQAIACAILLLLYLAAGGLFSAAFGFNSSMLLALAGLITCAMVFKETLTNGSQALFKTRIVAIANFAYLTLWILLVVVIIVFGGDLHQILIAQFIGLVIGVAFLMIGIRPAVRIGNPSKQLKSPLDLRRLIPYAATILSASIINLVMQRQSEVLWLGYFRTSQEAAYFDLGYSIPQLALEFVPLALYPIGLATFAERYTVDRASLSRSIRWYYKVLALVVLPVAVLGLVFGSSLVTMLYGGNMGPAGQLVEVFFIIHVFPFFIMPVSLAMYVSEKAWMILPISLVSALLNIALDFVFIPIYGIRAPIIIIPFVVLIQTLAIMILARRVIGRWKTPWRYLGRCIIATLPLLLFLPLRSYLSDWLSLAIALPIGIGFWLMAIKRLGLIDSDVKNLISSLPTFPRSVVGRLLAI